MNEDEIIQDIIDNHEHIRVREDNYCNNIAYEEHIVKEMLKEAMRRKK